MTVLVVDNHDSFTYNLVHLIAEITGEFPRVVRNDGPETPLDLGGVSHVVISPGPGHPAEPGDFGVCAALIQKHRVPVLGICLGFQGIAHAFGAAVTPGHALHGRSSRIRHTGHPMFRGCPETFQAVRYHSLHVDALPPSLEATAYAEDGALMGLAHRNFPLWGVQFHPESIASQCGRELLRNFLALAPDGDGAGTQVIAEEVPLDGARACLEASQVYAQLIERSEPNFWLDSATATPAPAAGTQGSATATPSPAAGKQGSATATPAPATARPTPQSACAHGNEARFSYLGSGPADGVVEWDRIRPEPIESPELEHLPFEFHLGWVGWLGYEGNEASRFLLADRAVVLDHRDARVWVLSLSKGASARAEANAEWHRRTVRALRTLGSQPLPQWRPPAGGTNLTARHGRTAYLRKINEAKAAIRRGDTYEVCLTNEVTGTFPGPEQVLPAYLALREISPAPFGALIRIGDTDVLSTSPERFLHVAQRVAESRPIKGTRPRGTDSARDTELAKELADSEKDRAENLMIVDLVRHDLGRVAPRGGVWVPELLLVETFAGAHQMVSTVRAELAQGFAPKDAVESCFPGGSMTGAPKERTMSILRELEEGPRGVYAGCLGFVSFTGEIDLAMVIRTVVVRTDEGGRSALSYGTGGAITALSDATEEYEETRVKAWPLLQLMAASFPDHAED